MEWISKTNPLVKAFIEKLRKFFVKMNYLHTCSSGTVSVDVIVIWSHCTCTPILLMATVHVLKCGF